jgi:multidrug resistance efflux pump
MDPNLSNQTASSQPSPIATPSASPLQEPTSKKSRKWIKIVLGLIILILLAAGGFLGYKYYFAQNTTYNAGVYKEPTVTKVTPTPSGYQLNPNDTSNQAIDSDMSEIDKNMTSLDNDITNIDQSLNDQQTNLQ